MTLIVAAVAGLMGVGPLWSATADDKASRAQKPSPAVLRLSQDDAVALFLRQNFDLLITKFGIEY
ncbi:MAG TPA: hypothetical protein VGA17_11050, partial [Nitrospiraceae bacterium]